MDKSVLTAFNITVGCKVKVRYGTVDSPDLYEGTVTSMGDDFLILDDKIMIMLNVLRSIEKIITPSLKQTQIHQESDAVNNESSRGFRIERQIPGLPLARAYNFVPQEWNDQLIDRIKKCRNQNLKSALTAVNGSFKAALKNNEVIYRYHDLRAKVLLQWNECRDEADHEIFYAFVGVLAMAAKEFDYALEPLVRAKKFDLAACAASLGRKVNEAEIFNVCSLLSGESKEITQHVADILKNRRDFDALNELLNLNKDDADMCERIVSCAYAMFLESKGTLQSDIDQHLSAYESAKRLLDAVPDGWKKASEILPHWNEYKQYSYPKSEAAPVKNTPDRLTGKIYRYERAANKNWGFISPDHFFYIKQVDDSSENGLLLRKMLYAGLWSQLEVSFRLGESQNKPGQSAANHIELTDAGYEEAQRRLSEGECSIKICEGYISAFYVDYSNGKIQSKEEDQTYGFNLDSIADPWLRACLIKNNVLRHQDVTFEVYGKSKAVNICWQDYQQEDRDAYDEYVTNEERKEWDAFLEKRAADNKKIVLPDKDPYRNYYYVALPDWKEQQRQTKPKPFSWQTGTISVTPMSDTTPINQLAPLIDNKPVSAVPESKNFRQAAMLAERARRAALDKKLEEAERDFTRALELAGFDESLVADLIFLYLRMDGKIDNAEQLLNKYKDAFSKEKLLNLKISFCEKKKDYATLCNLYEEAFQRGNSISIKAHNLFRMIGNYINLSRYEDALKACRRWEMFYDQNKYTLDAGKLQKALPNIKRRKAMCYYYLGNVEEARSLATDLIRLNPADEVAVKILDGTLTAIGGVLEDSTKVDGDDDDNSLKAFIRYMIVQSKISERLITENVRDEKYIGSSADALRDVELLASGRSRNRRSDAIKRTVSIRSDDLFAACKIVEQIEQRDDNPFRPNYKYVLAGRAIASWGDSMIVSGCNQIDVPRMAYLYALEMLHTTEEQDWCNSFNRYLRSFSLTSNETDSLESYINKQSGSQRTEGIDIQFIRSLDFPSVFMHEFLIGMIQLIAAIERFPRTKGAVIEALYKKDDDWDGKLTAELASVLKKNKAGSLAEFRSQLGAAVNLMSDQSEKLYAALFDVSRTLAVSALDKNALQILGSTDWNCCLNSIDVKRLQGIIAAFQCMQDYYNSADFDNRESCLDRAINRADELLKSFQREPTDMSYERFRPVIEHFNMILSDKRASLYQNFQPQLTWNETLQPFRTPDGQIQIQLAVENKSNCQSADQIQIVNVHGDEIRHWSRNNFVFNLRGGEKTDVSLTVTIDDAADKTGSFSMSIEYSYRCSDSPQNIITRNKIDPFTFVIRDENPRYLEDPFEEYIGQVIRDESMFMGRTDEINRIIRIIKSNDSGKMNYGRALAIYGQTRTGKSSLLFHVKEKLKREYSKDVLVWDMGNIAETAINIGDEPDEYLSTFLHDLLMVGQFALKRDESGVAQSVADANLHPPLNEILDQPGQAALLFTIYMRQLNQILEQKNKIIVLLIDEFTYLHGEIKRGAVSPGFMRFWKALLQNYCIFAIIVGQDDMPEFMREYQNEFACMEPLKLTYLREADAKRLMREPLERANDMTDLFNRDGSLDMLYELTAGSAYLTMVLCSNLVRYLNDKGAYKITRGIISDFLRTRAFGANSFLTEYYFESQLQERGHREFDDANKEILLSIARLSQNKGDAPIDEITCSGKTADEIQMLVERLHDRNVLLRKGRDRYSIQVKLLERWLISTMGV